MSGDVVIRFNFGEIAFNIWRVLLLLCAALSFTAFLSAVVVGEWTAFFYLSYVLFYVGIAPHVFGLRKP